MEKENKRYLFSRTKEEFVQRQRRAVEERGSVMPGLNEGVVDVVNVSPHDFHGDNPIGQARIWAKTNLAGQHEINDGNQYSISHRAIEKYLSQSANNKSDNLGAHLSVLKRLPDVINASVAVEIHPDYKKGIDGVRRAENGVDKEELLIHRMYGAVDIDGISYRVKTTMHEFIPGSTDSNAPHSFEVIKIEVLGEPNTSIVEAYTASSDKESQQCRTAKLLKDVEKSYDPGKKLLDESARLQTKLKQTIKKQQKKRGRRL